MKHPAGVICRASAAAVLALVLAGCASDGTAEVDTAGKDGVSHEATVVDIGELKGQEVTLGRAFSGNVLPLVAPGDRDHHSLVALLDAATGTISLTPELPTDGWLADTDAVATSDSLVLSANVCSTPPVLGRAGAECSGGGTSTATYFVLAHGAENWEVALAGVPDQRALQILSVSPTSARTGDSSVSLTAPSQRLRAEEITFGPTLAVKPVEATPVAPECAQAQQPAMTFSGLNTPAKANLPAWGSRRARTVDLPSSLRQGLTPLVGSTLRCSSAGAFVLLPGQTVVWGDGSTGSGRGDGTDSQSGGKSVVVPNPPTGNSTNLIYDLDNPEDPPMRAGDAKSFGDFRGGRSYWVLDDGQGLHIYSRSSGREVVGKLKGPYHLRSLDSVVVVERLDSDGALENIETVDPGTT